MACRLAGPKPLTKLLIWHLETNFSENLIKNQTFSFKKIYLNISSGKWQPSCLGHNELMSSMLLLSCFVSDLWNPLLCCAGSQPENCGGSYPRDAVITGKLERVVTLLHSYPSSYIISVAYCMIAVAPLLRHWRYCTLVLNHQCIMAKLSYIITFIW